MFRSKCEPNESKKPIAKGTPYNTTAEQTTSGGKGGLPEGTPKASKGEKKDPARLWDVLLTS